MCLAESWAGVEHHVSMRRERIWIDERWDMRVCFERMWTNFDFVLRPVDGCGLVSVQCLANNGVAIRIAPQDQVVTLDIFGRYFVIEFGARLTAEQSAPSLHKAG